MTGHCFNREVLAHVISEPSSLLYEYECVHECMYIIICMYFICLMTTATITHTIIFAIVYAMCDTHHNALHKIVLEIVWYL